MADLSTFFANFKAYFATSDPGNHQVVSVGEGEVRVTLYKQPE